MDMVIQCGKKKGQPSYSKVPRSRTKGEYAEGSTPGGAVVRIGGQLIGYLCDGFDQLPHRKKPEGENTFLD